jgi:hypothetical protein
VEIFASPSLKILEILHGGHKDTGVDSAFLSSVRTMLSKLRPVELELDALGYRTAQFLLEAIALDQLETFKLGTDVGFPFMSPFGGRITLKPIHLPNLTNLYIGGLCLPHCVHFFGRVKADKLKYLVIKVPSYKGFWDFDEEPDIFGAEGGNNDNTILELGMPLEMCIRHLCKSLGPDAEGNVVFSGLAHCEIEINTAHPANYETELIIQDILDMLEDRSEAGAVPMVLVGFPKSKIREENHKNTNRPALRCRFELEVDSERIPGSASVSVDDELALDGS